jgi:hypothetical protein
LKRKLIFPITLFFEAGTLKTYLQIKVRTQSITQRFRRGRRKGLEKVNLSETLNPVARGFRALKIKQ